MSDFFGASVRIPDVVEPIVGYRSWRIGVDSLISHGEVRWPIDGLQARCRRGTRGCGDCPSPSSDGHVGYGCGIYAYKEARDMLLYGGIGDVNGVVELWGRVYEHEHGWRAEHGRVVALYESPHLDGFNDGVIAEVAEFYGVPLLPYPGVQAPDDLAWRMSSMWVQRPLPWAPRRSWRAKLAAATSSRPWAIGFGVWSAAWATFYAIRGVLVSAAFHAVCVLVQLAVLIWRWRDGRYR